MGAKKSLALSLVVLLTLSTVGLGAQDTTVVEAQAEPTLVVGETTLDEGETGTVDLRLSAAPDGLTGYRVTVSLDDPDVATITDASVSDAFQLAALRSATVAPDGNSVVLKAADATRNVQAGATDVPLASIDVEGESPGRTSLSVSVDLVQDDQRPPQQLSPEVAAGSVSVDGPDRPPTADAGEALTVTEGTEVTLDASGSSGADGDLTYTWTQTGGPPVTLSETDVAAPTFTAPRVDAPTDLAFEVRVADRNGRTDTDTVTVGVEPGSEGTARFSVTDLDVPERVTRGGTLTVAGTVTNTGDAEGTETVYARVDTDRDGTFETVRSRSVTLGSGESERFSTTRTVPDGLDPGTYTGGLFTDDSERLTRVDVVAATPDDPDETTESRDEIARAKYGLAFDELSAETARAVEELYRRQSASDGQSPASLDTRDEIAMDRYGVAFDELSRETTVEVQAAFDAQFGDRGAGAAYTRDEIAEAKYGLAFDELSAETAGRVEELYDRQPFAGDRSPSEVQTREEIAETTYGTALEQLSRETRLAVERSYHEQFEGEEVSPA